MTTNGSEEVATTRRDSTEAMMGDSLHVADGPPGPAIISIDFNDDNASITGQESPGNAFHFNDSRRAINVDDGFGSGDYATGSIWPADPMELGEGFWPDVCENHSNTPTDMENVETQTRAVNLQPTLSLGIDAVNDDEPDEQDIYRGVWPEPHRPTSSLKQLEPSLRATTSLSSGHERGEAPAPHNHSSNHNEYPSVSHAGSRLTRPSPRSNMGSGPNNRLDASSVNEDGPDSRRRSDDGVRSFHRFNIV